MPTFVDASSHDLPDPQRLPVGSGAASLRDSRKRRSLAPCSADTSSTRSVWPEDWPTPDRDEAKEYVTAEGFPTSTSRILADRCAGGDAGNASARQAGRRGSDFARVRSRQLRGRRRWRIR